MIHILVVAKERKFPILVVNHDKLSISFNNLCKNYIGYLSLLELVVNNQVYNFISENFEILTIICKSISVAVSHNYDSFPLLT